MCLTHFTLYIIHLDHETALDHFEKGLQYAKAYDDLPEISPHTSVLVRGNEFNARNIYSCTEQNEVARELGYLLESNSYRELKDTPRMQALVAKYEPFVGKKRDFS